MVNEINKPPSSDHLNERLAASNRQLREMQEEHRALLQEMEALRERATELNRLNLQRQQLHQHQNQFQESEGTKTDGIDSHHQSNDEAHSSTTGQMSVESNPSSEQADKPQDASVNVTNNETEVEKEEDTDSAEYIKKKIEEIASLKAQYKRVQHMVNTTNLIEQHLSSKSALDATTSGAVQEQQSSTSSTLKAPPTTTKVAPSETATTSAAPSDPANSNNASEDPKVELLTAMLSMFTDFSDDLRSQAESLRAERERIRDLKEMLLQRRKGDS